MVKIRTDFNIRLFYYFNCFRFNHFKANFLDKICKLSLLLLNNSIYKALKAYNLKKGMWYGI